MPRYTVKAILETERGRRQHFQSEVRATSGAVAVRAYRYQLSEQGYVGPFVLFSAENTEDGHDHTQVSRASGLDDKALA